MTTATDPDVQVTNATTGEVYPSQVLNEVARLDGAASDGVPVPTALEKENALLSEYAGRLGSEVLDLAEQNERLHAELATLKTELHPLDPRRDGWTPRPKTMPRRHWTQVHSVADLTEQQRNSALIEPKLDELRDGDGEIHLGAPIAGELLTGVDRKPGWATWLGEIHHADAEWADIVARLRAMPDAYVAPPIERTVVEPVAVDYSYRNTDAWTYAQMVVGQSRQQSVYAELAPERIQADVPMIATSGHEPPPQDLTPAERAIVDDATQRRKALAQAAHGERAELPEPEGTVRASRWARLVAWSGGATTRRRQTEQDGVQR